MITIFKLGHIGNSAHERILPGPEAGNKLRDALNSAKQIVWSADIEPLYVAETIEELETITAYNNSR